MIGAENCYTCSRCGKIFTTIDSDEGVTPFMVGHAQFHPNGKCDGDCYSAFYPKGPRPPHIPAPAWEWYKPSDAEVNAMPESHRDHYRMGGLNLRRISK